MKNYTDITSQVKSGESFLNENLIPNINKMIAGNLKSLKKKRYVTWYKLMPSELYKTILRSDKSFSYDVLEKRNYYNFIPSIFNAPQIAISEASNIIRLIQLQLQIQKYLSDQEDSINSAMDAMDYLDHNNLGTVVNLFKSRDEKAAFHEHKEIAEEGVHVLQDFIEKINEWDYQLNHLSQVKSSINASRKEYVQLSYKFLSDTKTNKNATTLPFNQWLIDYIDQIKSSINKHGYATYHAQLNRYWKMLKEEQARKDLESHPLQFLQNKYPDLPNLDKLTNTGLSLADLSSITAEELRDIYGFSTRDAELINNKVTITKAQIVKDAMPRFNADRLNSNNLRFLSLLKFTSSYSEYQIDIQKNTILAINLFYKLYSSLTKNVKSNSDINYLSNDQYKKWIHDLRQLYSVASTICKARKEIDLLKCPETNFKVIKEDFIKNGALYFTLIEKFSGQDTKYATASLPKDIVEQVQHFKLITKDLKVKMRNYQDFGAKYILSYRSVLLGDEMGLGKTIQALVVINHLYQSGEKHSIVVCPLSILENWKQETKKWSKLPIFAYRGNKRDKAFNSWRKDGGILITNYEQCFRIVQKKAIPKITCIVVDEAHYIKNPDTRRSKNVTKLVQKAKYKLFMSGTPLENNLPEMKQLISILNPNVLKKIKQREQITPISIEQFREMIATVYLRRKRKEVLSELPKISIIDKWSTFTAEEQKFYDECIEEASNGMALGALVKMRRAAFIDEESEKIDQIKEITTEAKSVGKKVIVFSFFKEAVLRKLAKLLPNTMEDVLSGDISPKQRQELIKKFTNSRQNNVLLSQIEAGGVGLNIQTASIVILCEPQWKPSTEQQAISRVYRMGQTRDVLVYRLLTMNSLDETMDDLIDAKQAVFDAYANDSALQEAFADSLKNIQKKVFNIEKQRFNLKKESSLGQTKSSNKEVTIHRNSIQRHDK